MVIAEKQLSIKDLSVKFLCENRWVNIIEDINIDINTSHYTAIIGESGCGKSILGQAVLNILPSQLQKNGTIKYGLNNILEDFSIIPQSPNTSLNPIRKIYLQMQDILESKNITDENNIYKKQCLKFFGLQDVERVLQSYPYELSGGMLQRVLFAMAISTNPKCIFADEPTKGLDEITGDIIFNNLQFLRNNKKNGMIIITHDINLVKNLCDTIIVMYAGQIVEINNNFIEQPFHPYSQGLLSALPENGLIPIEGKTPEIGKIFSGCKFSERCKYCQVKCRYTMPQLKKLTKGVQVRCFLYD